MLGACSRCHKLSNGISEVPGRKNAPTGYDPKAKWLIEGSLKEKTIPKTDNRKLKKSHKCVVSKSHDTSKK